MSVSLLLDVDPDLIYHRAEAVPRHQCGACYVATQYFPRKYLALNIILATAIAAIGWLGCLRYKSDADQIASVKEPVKYLIPDLVTSLPKPRPINAAEYSEVSAKNLFSKDRNPKISATPDTIEPPRIMPPLPAVYGVASLSRETVAFVSERAGGASKLVSVGDRLGEFEVTAMDRDKVTFGWNGKQVERYIHDLTQISASAGNVSNVLTARSESSGAQVGSSIPHSGPLTNGAGLTSRTFKDDLITPDAAVRACKPGETAPMGMVVDGYVRSGFPSPVGLTGCRWVKSD